MSHHIGSFECKLKSEHADILRARGLAPKINKTRQKTTPPTYTVTLREGWTTTHWPVDGQFCIILCQGNEVVASGIVGEELTFYRPI